ncbi:MAG: TonB-dependent receptor [Acidobacteria bacterium]|nr:TonB-dependent receptor [Acidobacteriota bacterium]
MARLRVRGLSLFVFLCAASVSFAQMSTGTISGTVSDATGAVVPGATVTVKNVDTGLTRNLEANERGRFVAPQLPVGSFEITATSQGFQTEVRRGITLAVGQEVVVSFVLNVGSVTETVEVTGEAPLVETTTATTSGLVDERAVRELPLNGRSFTDLMALQANVKNLVQVRGSSPNIGYGANFSVAGSHPVQVNYVIDGLMVNDSRTSSPASASGNLLGTDTIREFRMLTSNFSAEFGLVSGGIMTAVSKTGTNALHGSVFEFLRNSTLDARRFFDRDPSRPTVRSDPPPFKRNQFGFTLGGPIQKDRMFFFGSYEGLRERLASTQIIGVPTEAARRGFLPTGPCASGCAVGERARQVLNLFPLPNGRDRGDGVGDYLSAFSNPTNEDFFTVRIDRTLSEKHFLFGSYTSSDGDVANPAAVGLFETTRESHYKRPVLSLTSLLSPNVLLALRVGVNRSLAANLDTRLPGVDVSPLIFGPGLGAGSVSITGCCSFTAEQFTRYNWTSFQYAGDVTYTRGNHSIKTGAALLRNWSNQNRAISQRNGTFTFSSLATFYAQTPSSSFSAGPGSTQDKGWRQWFSALYLQDDWKPIPNLTLNLGLRFEWNGVPTEVNNQTTSVPNIFTDTQITVGGPFWLMESAFAHAEPRVGLAWDPFSDGKTSLRAGFGVFQEAIRNTEYTTAGDQNFPFWNAVLFSATPGNPIFWPDLYANFNRPGPPIAYRLDIIEYRLNQPYKANWSFNIQREVVPGTLVNLGYVGARGVNLLAINGDANQPASVLSADGRMYIPLGTPRRNTAFSQNRIRFTGNDSYYHSMQLMVQKRFSRGFQISSSYTWSKSVDTSSIKVSQGTEFAGNAVENAFPFDTKANRGPSSWDIRQYWSTNYVYELPFGPGQPIGGQTEGIGARLLEGWSLSGVIQLNSGPPFSPGLAFDYAGALPQSGGGGQKPELVSGASLNPVLDGYREDPDHYFDPLGFVLPPLTPQCAVTPAPTGCPRRIFGNVGRNTLTGPGFASLNFSVLKTTNMTERFQMQFRGEFFNLLNRANFSLPNTSIFQGSAGTRNTQAGRITGTVGTARQIQFGLKLIF